MSLYFFLYYTFCIPQTRNFLWLIRSGRRITFLSFTVYMYCTLSSDRLRTYTHVCFGIWPLFCFLILIISWSWHDKQVLICIWIERTYAGIWSGMDFPVSVADKYLYQLLIDLHAYAYFGRYRRRASIEFMNANEKCVKINFEKCAWIVSLHNDVLKHFINV
jgi:hypothetical protein